MSDQLKVRVLFDLTLPEGMPVERYKRAVGEALDVFQRAEIKPRVASVTFAATETTPAVHAEFREQPTGND